MTTVVFYEKPGCVGNQQQKALLRGLGYELNVVDLLSYPWTGEALRPFFGDVEVSRWFNPSAPDVKEGRVDPNAVTAAQALRLLCDSPILIRRPLMAFGVLCQSGFDQGPVLDALGVKLDSGQDLQTCPMGEPHSACVAP